MSSSQGDAWLFTRGADSVRLLREERSDSCVLVVHGPAAEVVTYAFANVAECMKRQPAIEQQLLAEGYQLAQPASDRRSEPRMERVPDHHRAAS
jgi:hypothetical protein